MRLAITAASPRRQNLCYMFGFRSSCPDFGGADSCPRAFSTRSGTADEGYSRERLGHSHVVAADSAYLRHGNRTTKVGAVRQEYRGKQVADEALAPWSGISTLDVWSR